MNINVKIDDEQADELTRLTLMEAYETSAEFGIEDDLEFLYLAVKHFSTPKQFKEWTAGIR